MSWPASLRIKELKAQEPEIAFPIHFPLSGTSFEIEMVLEGEQRQRILRFQEGMILILTNTNCI